MVMKIIPLIRYSNDVEVIITYHTFSEESDLEEDEESKESISEKAEDKAVESILTIETCADLEKHFID